MKKLITIAMILCFTSVFAANDTAPKKNPRISQNDSTEQSVPSSDNSGSDNNGTTEDNGINNGTN